MNKTCIYCQKKLDGSDEHIIPKSINGNLHTKNLICSDCNNRFGTKVDAVLKENFAFLLHLLGVGSMRRMIVATDDGTEYIRDNKSGQLKQSKPDIQETKLEDGRVALKISGSDTVATFRAIATKAVRRFGRAAMKAEFTVTREQKFSPSVSSEWKLSVDETMILAINKIITEFYCYVDLDRSMISPLIEKVGNLDTDFENLIICNNSFEVREPEETEISHLIVIRSDEERKIIYAYLEIFNTLCVYCVLVKDYDGKKIDKVYHQDALTKEVLAVNITLNIGQIDGANVDYAHNLGALLSRYQDKNLVNDAVQVCKKIRTDLDEEVKQDKVTKEQADQMFIESSVKAMAHLMVYVYPDAVDDFTEEEQKGVNYIHSVIREDKIEEFKFFYQNFIGHDFKFDDDDVIYKMNEFIFSRFKIKNGVKMMKAYCCFISTNDGSKKYWPVSDVFRTLNLPTYPEEFSWL
ncbi:uncharacterized protein YlaI [Pedobacter cryoconitis]|uniref:Uncharacterized protein YlaI n=1 Tax=Pedobacter cryoconitis TaxID=188932 RepID=A0A7W8ZPK1_9SPHI|nr:HNH endonuclease [Pedobacter cryoconitis]MBB5637678.1 uncharacterized protein YlaI [Pedobacter cryoconitis]